MDSCLARTADADSFGLQTQTQHFCGPIKKAAARLLRQLPSVSLAFPGSMSVASSGETIVRSSEATARRGETTARRAEATVRRGETTARRGETTVRRGE